MTKKPDSEVLVPTEQTVIISGEKLVVKPFSVKDIIFFTRDLVDGLQVIKEKYPSMEFSNEDILKYMPLVLGEAPRLFGLLARAIDKEGEWLENQHDLVGVSKLFLKVVSINDFGAIISNFKAGWSKLKSQVVAA
jgi:hypothetical protein